eukprot:gene1286-2484_t
MSDANGSNGVIAPVVRDVAGKGFQQIAIEGEVDSSVGSFSVHNMGMFGVRSCAPVVLPPQACALALGSITDTVVPRMNGKEGEDNWEIAPMVIATLSCDHRVVDGAVGAQYLAALKTLIENPMNMLM